MRLLKISNMAITASNLLKTDLTIDPQVYSGFTTYNIGDLVQDPTTDTIYKCLRDNVTAVSTGNALIWYPQQKTNKYRALDATQNSRTISKTEVNIGGIIYYQIVYTFDVTPVSGTANITDTIALFNLRFDKAILETTAVGSATSTIVGTVDATNPHPFNTLEHHQFEPQTTVVFKDLPVFTSFTITILLEKSLELIPVAVGSIIAGGSVSIGDTLKSPVPTIGISNTISRTRNSEGVILTDGIFTYNKVSATVYIPTQEVDIVFSLLSIYSNEFTVFILDDGLVTGGLEYASVLGKFDDITISLRGNKISTYKIDIQGVI